MPIKFELKIDGGLERYSVAINELSKNIKNFNVLFEMIVKYFEGKSIEFKNSVAGQDGTYTTTSKLRTKLKSPVEEIWKTKGGIINADWSNSVMYEAWKKNNWMDMREYSVPVQDMSEQILTGRTLYNLLNPGSDSIRMITNASMEYGIDIDYANYWQSKKRILDFFPDMITDINKIVVAFVRQCAALEWEGENL